MTTMTVNQTTLKKPQIQIKRVYKYNIHKIWTALTTSDALAAWLMKTENFELKVGNKFKFKDKPQGSWDGIVHCEILSINQPFTISYHWQANGMKHPTTVQWELKELSKEETLLTLSHTGFKGFSGWFTKQILAFGWKGILKKKLTKYLAI